MDMKWIKSKVNRSKYDHTVWLEVQEKGKENVSHTHNKFGINGEISWNGLFKQLQGGITHSRHRSRQNAFKHKKQTGCCSEINILMLILQDDTNYLTFAIAISQSLLSFPHDATLKLKITQFVRESGTRDFTWLLGPCSWLSYIHSSPFLAPIV